LLSYLPKKKKGAWARGGEGSCRRKKRTRRKTRSMWGKERDKEERKNKAVGEEEDTKRNKNSKKRVFVSVYMFRVT
jgi:hypothetical protein